MERRKNNTKVFGRSIGLRDLRRWSNNGEGRP